MNDDAKRWDMIHHKIQEKGDDGHSIYAQEKEKLFPRNGVVCDLGGGTGADALYFLRKGHQVILLDISQFALDAAQDKAKAEGLDKALAVRQVDYGLHELPLNPESLDVVYSRISLHYFPKDETVGIFTMIFNTLKVGGSAYLTFKSPDDAEEMEYLRENTVEYESGVFIENGQLRSRFTKTELEDMLATAGIQNYQVNPYQEELGPDKTGHQQILHLNEVVFTK